MAAGEKYLTNSDITDRVVGDGIVKIVKLTQSEYDALTTKDANTLYVVGGQTANTNYIKLSDYGDVGGYITITEIGGGLDITDIQNNPPSIIMPDERDIDAYWDNVTLGDGRYSVEIYDRGTQYGDSGFWYIDYWIPQNFTVGTNVYVADNYGTRS